MGCADAHQSVPALSVIAAQSGGMPAYGPDDIAAAGLPPERTLILATPADGAALVEHVADLQKLAHADSAAAIHVIAQDAMTDPDVALQLVSLWRSLGTPVRVHVPPASSSLGALVAASSL